MRGFATIAISFLSLLATGCITLNERAIDHDFTGVRSTMGRTHVVCMLLVHGMGGYSVGDPQTLISSIQTELHLQTAGSPSRTSVPNALGGADGSIIRQDFIDGSGNILRIYTLYWEPLTASLKKEYLWFDDQSAITRHRLPILNDLKQSLINENMADVVLYGGTYKVALQQSVRLALTQMRKELGGEKDYQYVFVTFSLGSRIIFDVIDQMENEAETTHGNAIVDKTASIFMLANQLPLFGLADVGADTQPANVMAGRGYETMLRFIDRKNKRRGNEQAIQPGERRSSGDLAIVSVNDPNDLFSYAIPPYIRERFPSTLINVQLSVAKTGYLVPTEGYVANPLMAHTGYGHDPDVIQLIIDGAKATPPLDEPGLGRIGGARPRPVPSPF